MAKKKDITPEDQKLWDAYKRTVKPLENSKNPSAPISPRPTPASPKPRPAKPSSLKALLPPSQKRILSEAELPSLEAPAQSRRRRKIRVEAELDLHGMTQAQAYQSLIRFITGCYATGKQTTLIITGKGRPMIKVNPSLSEERGVLRRAVPDWLSSPELRPYIIEYAQASVKDGGTGALYVYLKRNKSLANKEES